MRVIHIEKRVSGRACSEFCDGGGRLAERCWCDEEHCPPRRPGYCPKCQENGSRLAALSADGPSALPAKGSPTLAAGRSLPRRVSVLYPHDSPSSTPLATCNS